MELIRINDGVEISQPGAYEMSMDWYHEDNCAGPSISSSGLRQIENDCPAEYWAFSPMNPRAYATGDKPHFSFGRAAHCLILGDEFFKDRYAVRPLRWKDWKKIEAREWREIQIDDGMTVITHDDMKKISEMAHVMGEHPLIRDTDLMDGTMEASLIWQDRETGVYLKSRPDVIPAFEGAITDYKTAADARPDACRKSIAKFGYHMQMGLCAMGFEAILERPPTNFLLMFQQTTAPYHITPIEISPDAVYFGKCQVRRAVQTFARCLDADEWPSYTEEIPVFDLPLWLSEKLAAQQEAGSLPNLGGDDGKPVS